MTEKDEDERFKLRLIYIKYSIIYSIKYITTT